MVIKTPLDSIDAITNAISDLQALLQHEIDPIVISESRIAVNQLLTSLATPTTVPTTVTTPLGPPPGFAPLPAKSLVTVSTERTMPIMYFNPNKKFRPLRAAQNTTLYSAYASTTPTFSTSKGVCQIDADNPSSRPNKLSAPSFPTELLDGETLSTDELQSWHNYINRDYPSPESRTNSAYAAAVSLDPTHVPTCLELG